MCTNGSNSSDLAHVLHHRLAVMGDDSVFFLPLKEMDGRGWDASPSRTRFYQVLTAASRAKARCEITE
ncbi:hypothetical protein E2C01_029441 [Portunus trituberculatus]|uniref:Uncharacterized protein n=1 Tax=Portunus trituberculatus TaxID=210409 RepID=A0A5B7EMZ6_PORTR|nr:hypothetical protein [Portunus trituberculatus]